MSGKPQKHVHKINNCPIAASKAVPGSSLDADISALNDKLSTKKDRQDPVASPDADGSGIAFIDTLSQDTNGKITVTKKNVQQASTSSAGIVQLSSKIDSTSETMAATPKAVHDAIIEAEQATVAGLNAENTVPDGHYITSVNETDGIVSITTATMDDVPTQDSTKPVKSGGVFASIGAEAIERAGADAAFQQLIPPAASEHNQLADKAYVDAIGERVEARYLSYSQDGLPFPTYDDFEAAQQTDTFYYMNALTVPNNNDVIVITADGTHLNENDQPTTTRWRFFKPETGPGEWRYEYTINNSALSEAQLLAINSGINVVKVENYDAHLIDHNNPHQVTAAQVGLGNVDNTADLDKPISTATQTALDGKADNVVGGTANHIVVLGDNGKTLVDSHAAITSSYDGADEINPVTGSAVAAAIGELDAGPFGGEGKYIVSVSEAAGVVTATEGTLDAEPTENSTNPVKSGGVHQHLSTKADKDTDAVEDNVAVFDGNGNPVDSGISKNDLKAAISSAGSSIQGVSIDGTALTPGANNVVDIPLATTSADGAMSADDKAKLDGIASGAEVNVQADWNEADSTSDAFIQNKPNLATVATTGEYGDLLHIPADLVHDASYVHTDNNYTAAEKEKLSGIESGAEANVQSDWTESDGNSDAYIRNKPENLVQDADYVHTDNNYTTAEKEKLAGIEDGAEVNVIETVKVDDIPLKVTDKTVNIDLSGKADKAVPSAKGNLAGLGETGNLIDSGIPGTLDSVPTENSGNLVTSGAVFDAMGGKTDKVSDATPGNFAGLDDKGNLTDSGSKASDFATAVQGDKADSAVQTVSIAGGTPVGAGNDGNVDIPLSTSATDGAMSAADKAKLDGIASGAETNVQSDWNESDSSSDAFIKNKPANLVQDSNYVHTDNNYTTAEKTKLAGIAAGAEVNVQSDWTETDSNSDAFIQNKPANLVQDANYVHTDNNYTTADKNKLSSIAAGAEVNVQADWNEANSASDAYIKNKPTLATVATTGSYNDLTDKPTIPEIPVTDVMVNGTSVVDADGVAEVVIPAQQQADWNQSTTTAADFIKNKPDLSVYATKVGAATSGNFASLDANGNLTDSGHKHSDYKTKQTAKSSPAASGNTLAFIDTVTQNENGEITATKKNVTIDSALSSTSTNPVQNKAVDAALSGKADKATNLTGATKTKITYNSQGIVTAGADLEASDIPDLDASKITTGTLPVGRGGTGAGTVEGARTNLDVYSKAEVDARLSGRVEVVSALPATGETGVIYYVGPTGTGGDQYEEYIWAKEEGASAKSWIKVGEPTIDLSGYKTKQTAKTSPSASGNTLAFIDTVSQNENGEITATKKNVTIDSALSSTSTNPVQNKAVESAISAINAGKADKVTGATSGNFASLDANGNLTDSGHKHSDYKTKQTAKGDPTASGTTLTAIATISQDANGVITATKKTIQPASGTQDGVMPSSHYTKLEGISTGANKVEASTTNGNIKIDGTETTVYTHPADGANTSKGDTANQTPAFGGTFKVTSETVDAMGHTTVLAEHTVKIPNATAVASTGGTGGSVGLMSAADKEKLNGIATGAEVNQNAFSNVKVGTATVAADAKTDTIELATTGGKHIVLTADTANDKVTIDTDLSSKSAASGGTAESLVTTGEKYTWNSKASGTHTHGNITNDGKIGSTANLSVVTGTDGAVTTADLTTASPSVPSSGTTTSLSFIDTVSQDSKGKITATKKTVLVDSTYSSTGTNPVNGKAIAAAIGGLDSNKTSTDGTNVQVKVTLADGKVSAVNVTTDNTENKSNKVSSWQTTPDNTHYPSEKLVKDSLGAKADKVSGATSGNFAGLDSNGNLMDSGSKASDFATSEQGRKADSAIQGVKVNNTTLTPDANKVVTVPLATTSADGAISAADKTKLDGIAAGAEANVQADWNVTDSSSDAFIKNKPQYKYYSTTSTYVKICSFPLDADGENVSGYGIDILYRRYLGEVHGRLLYKKNFKFYCEYTGDISYTNQSYSFYYVVNSNKMDVYAKRNGYATLNVAPLTNIPKDQVDFTNFGTEVSSLPDGATEITPVWVVNSSSSSGTAPVKVNAYGGLTPVPMDSTPTASSTNLMTSGAIKTALDGKAASSHTHGNIQNGGALQTTDVVIANGDKLVITDASDSNKVARSSTAFDGSTITKALTQKGTFESVVLADDAMPLSAADGVKITYSGSTATISGNFAAGAGVDITYANNVATFSADISAIPLATIAALS